MNRISNYQQENEDVIVSRILLAIQEQIDQSTKKKSEDHPKRLAKTIVSIEGSYDPKMSDSIGGDVDASDDEAPLFEATQQHNKKAQKRHKAPHSRSEKKASQPSKTTWFSLAGMNHRFNSRNLRIRSLIGLIIFLLLLIIVGMSFLAS